MRNSRLRWSKAGLTLLALHAVQGCLAEGNRDCPSCGVSRASTEFPFASVAVLAGSVEMLAVSGEVVIKGVEASGTVVALTLESVADGSRLSIQVSAEVLKRVALAAGCVVKVVSLSTGRLLVASGEVLAFIPNEVGTALLNHASYP